VLGRPDRLETALLQRAGKLRRRHRIIRKEHRAAEIYVPLLRYLLVRRTEVSRWRRPTLSVTYRTLRGSREPRHDVTQCRQGEGFDLRHDLRDDDPPSCSLGCQARAPWLPPARANPEDKREGEVDRINVC
jgi:hypothetical protein